MKLSGELDTLINDIVNNNINQLKSMTVDIRDYGVFANGKDDDTTAIQMAIDENSGKKSLYFPRGTYLIKQIRLKKNTVIIGESKHTTIFKSIDNNENSSLFYGEDLDFQHSIIKNIGIDGNKENNKNVINGIHLKMVNEESYELVNNYDDILIYNCTGSGLVLDGKAGSGLFIQVRLNNIFSYKNNEYGYLLNYISDSYINNCEACQNLKGGFKGIIYSTKIVGNKAWFNGFTNNGAGFDFNNSTRINMVACESQDNWGHGIKTVDSTFINLNGCEVDNNGVLASENLVRQKRTGTCEFSGVYFNNVTRSNINIYADNFMYGTYGYMQKSAVEIIGGGVITANIKTRNQEQSPIIKNVDITNCELIIDGKVYDKSKNYDLLSLNLRENYSINTINSMNRLTLKNNRVHLQCIIENQSNIENSLQTIFTLPEEYRPKNAISYVCMLGSSAYNFQAVGNLLVSINGNVAINNITGNDYKFASILIEYDI